MKSIILIYPYFGTLPSQYKMWRASALQNPSVDFMFFTDAAVEPAYNIIVHKMCFDEFRGMVQQVFDFPIVLDRPYKLCEYKQTYGLVLHNYIKEYDYWGFGDIDAVLGDLRAFITNEVLTHQFILGWGHLTLLHNDSETNTYFMHQEDGFQDYHDAFTTSRITFFDEFGHGGCSDKWRTCIPADCWLQEPFDNVSKPKQAYHFNSLTHPYWQQIVFEYYQGKLYAVRFRNGMIEKRETLYAHFQHRPFMRDSVKDYAHFLVTPSAIIDYPRHFSKLWIRYYCRRQTLRTKYYQWKDRIIWKLGLFHFR